MPIYNAISILKSNAPLTLQQASAFMGHLPPKLQMQIIAAIYIGRDHIHSNTWSEDVMLSTDYIDHIPPENYAQIVYEKNSALVRYLESIERCASNTGFNLNNL
ncbi:hypothetical protein KZY42_004407 [Vibrio vulnificus]|nr:hypothetical protein [Vibrio vulnificus]